jgi:hypothetical protein
MSTATSVPPATLETSNGSRRSQQAYSGPSRTQSTRTRSSAVPPSPQRASSSYSRPPTSSRPVEEILPQRDYETTNVAQSSRRRSTDRSAAVRADSARNTAGHHRASSRHHYAPSDMSGTTAVANDGGPAPVVTPIESRHTSKGRSRTTIPAKTGNWILGKTIGAGSMGKVKLARRVEGGEQVSLDIVLKVLHGLAGIDPTIGCCEDCASRIHKRRFTTSESRRP